VTGEAAPVLTLEPFIEGVRQGVEASGWALSGLQKTTSHEFAGRWEGESSRSAYLFFHRPGGRESVGIEAFLDETTRGLHGNLSLVVEGASVERMGDPRGALGAAGAATNRRLSRMQRASVSLKLRLDNAATEVDDASSEIRIKVRVPQVVLEGGTGAVADLASRIVRSFETLLEDAELARYSESQ
jgi:hypothetical protein